MYSILVLAINWKWPFPHTILGLVCFKSVTVFRRQGCYRLYRSSQTLLKFVFFHFVSYAGFWLIKVFLSFILNQMLALVLWHWGVLIRSSTGLNWQNSTTLWACLVYLHCLCLSALQLRQKQTGVYIHLIRQINCQCHDLSWMVDVF